MHSLFTDYMIVADITLVGVLIYIFAIIQKSHKANKILAAFIISISSPLFLGFISHIVSSFREIIFCFAVAFTSVSGALIYLYIDSLSGQRRTNWIRKFLLFSPFPVFFIVLKVILSLFPTAEGKPAFSLAVGIVLISSIAVSTVYLFTCFIGIRRYSQNIENWFSDTEKVSILWLNKITVLSLILFFMWDMGIGLEIFGIIRQNPYMPLPHLLLIGVIAMMTTYHIIRQPYIFRKGTDLDMAMNSSDREIDQPKTKYARQSIDLESQKQGLSILLDFMKDSKPYLNEDVTIHSISEAINIPIHHLSIIINSLCNKNFTTFINEYRVAEVMRILNEKPDANILSVAFQSGFSSKSSFNKAFKKITGKTPSGYRSGLAI